MKVFPPLLTIACVLSLFSLTGCNGERVGPDIMKKLEGGTVVRMEANFLGSDAVVIKSKAGCEWRIQTPKGKNNMYAKPVDKSCDK